MRPLGMANIKFNICAATITSCSLFLLLVKLTGKQSPSSTFESSESYGRGLLRPNRFPVYGTQEYLKRCKWLLEAANRGGSQNCTFYYGLKRSRPSEGMSFWITQVVSSHLLALQAGCRLWIDYGDIDLIQILTVPDSRFAWTAPPGYSCESDIYCYQIDGWSLKGKTITKEIILQGENKSVALAPVPRYRYAYGIERFRHGDNLSVDLERVLPGFDIHDGMACSLGALFQLSPSASKFEPELFKSILPALLDGEALVIGVYIRTGWTDRMAQAFGVGAANSTEYREDARRLVDAVLKIERTYLCKENGTLSPPSHQMKLSRIVWMVATDWPEIKHWIADTYDGSDANQQLPRNEQKYADRRVPRRVITTQSKGKQTKFNDRPALSDFAEGFLDWWLLGLTDLVVKHKWSFAETAALRTSAPLYQGDVYKPLLAHPDTLVRINKDGSNEDIEKGHAGWEEERKKSLTPKIQIEIDLNSHKKGKSYNIGKVSKSM